MGISMTFSLRLAAVAGALALCVSSAHAATVTLLTEAYDQLYGLTTDGKKLYVSGTTGPFRDFNGAPNGVIGSVSLATGKLKTLYDPTNYGPVGMHVAPFQIAASGNGTLFWADPDAGPGTGSAFLTGPGNGKTPPVQFFNTCCGADVLPGDGTGMAFTKTRLYFADGLGGRIGSINRDGTGLAQIGPTRYQLDFGTASYTQITVASDKIFIADSGENRTVDSQGRQIINDVSARIAPGVRWISATGASGFVELSVGKIPRPIGLVSAGNSLYVTSGDTIWKVNASTGKTKKFLRNPRFVDLQGIVYVDGVFYVADSRTTFGPFVGGVATATGEQSGVIWKIVP